MEAAVRLSSVDVQPGRELPYAKGDGLALHILLVIHLLCIEEDNVLRRVAMLASSNDFRITVKLFKPVSLAYTGSPTNTCDHRWAVKVTDTSN